MNEENLIPIVVAWMLEPCELCGEPWCQTHRMHYANCPCMGPDEARDKGYQLVQRGHRWFAKKSL